MEADTKGKIHEEPFTITDREIEELKKEIIRVALEISQGSFLIEQCDSNVSGYCDLAEQFQRLKGTVSK